MTSISLKRVQDELSRATQVHAGTPIPAYCNIVAKLRDDALKAVDLVQDGYLRDVTAICSFTHYKASLLFRDITFLPVSEYDLMLSQHNVPLYPILHYVTNIMMPAFNIDLADYAQGLKSGMPRIVILNIVQVIAECINAETFDPNLSEDARKCMLKTGRLIVMCLHGTVQYRELLKMNGFRVYYNNWVCAVSGIEGADDIRDAVTNGKSTILKDTFDDCDTLPKRKSLPTFTAVANAASERDIYSQLHAIIGDDTLSRAQVKTVILALYASLDILFPDE